MNKARVSFARTLPIAALLLSFLLTAIPATIAYRHQLQLGPHQDHTLSLSLAAAASHTSRAVQAFNLPAFFVEFATGILAGSWPQGWSPSSFDLPSWRAIIFPIYCLPFWGFAGFAIDALLAGDRLRRSALVAGCVLWALLFSLLCVFHFFTAQRGAILYSGLAFWIILLAVFPVLWIQQRLAHKRLRTRVAERLFSGA